MNTTTALITGSITSVAAQMRAGKTALLPFGRDYYALFCQASAPAMDTMARLKGRPASKPFVRGTYAGNAAALLASPGIAATVSPAALDRAAQIFAAVTRRHPIGILLSANPAANLPARLLGSLALDGQRRPTVGFMVAGPDHEFAAVLRLVAPETGVVAGTSANLSGDQRSGGSGHHRLAGAARDFGALGDVCLFVPARFGEGRGPSATSIALSDDGLVAYLVRVGSTGRAELTSLLHGLGVEAVREVDGGAQIVSPYHYQGLPGGELALAAAHKRLWLRSRSREFYAAAR